MKFTHFKDTPRRHSPAVRLTIAASGFVLLTGILGYPVLAQVAATQALTNRGMPEEKVAAMHAVLKRPRPTASTEIDQTATTESDTFNTDQGPGPGPIGPGPGLQSLSCSRGRRHECPVVVLWTVSFHHQSLPGRACSIASHRPD